MDFRCDSTGDEYMQHLVPRSLVLLYGDARFKWCHGIAKRPLRHLERPKDQAPADAFLSRFAPLQKPG